jgi:membrane associated rhomboid family serine protease
MNEQMPLMTISLILSISLISFAAFNNAQLFDKLKHYPFLEKLQKSYYRWFTNGFLHGDWFHLLLNLFVLWQFGSAIELLYKAKFGFLLGGIIFLLTYGLILVLSCIPTYLKHKDNPILYYPFRLLFLFGLIPLPGIAMAILYLIYSHWASKNSQDNIDHDAHYYGAIIGLSLGILIKYLL